jgi:hypothetical protein
MSTEAVVKKHPTKAQFDKLKEKLSSVYSSEYLLIDGYIISAHATQVGMRVKIVIYVNGWIKGEWLWRGNEEDLERMPELTKRFHCLKSVGQSPSYIKNIEKFFGKKGAKEQGVYKKHYYTSEMFSTAGAFITHIKKHNDSIQILTSDEYIAALSELGVDDEQ